MFLYLLNISLPFILFRLLCFGWPSDAGNLWFFFILEVLPCGWGWMSGLSRFPGYGSFAGVLVGGAGSLFSGVQWSVC